MSEQLLDVLSVLDDLDNPVLSNCTLQMGELALEFKNGRSKVPLKHAAEVARHPQVRIPGYSGPVAPLPPNASAELPKDALEERERTESPEQREAQVKAAEEYLISQGLPVPSREDQPQQPDVSALETRVAELERMLEQAVSLGAPPADAGSSGRDGEPDTSGEKSTKPHDADELPKGFEATTADGKPRCHARKGDGSQCKNAALDGSNACNLKAHQKLAK